MSRVKVHLASIGLFFGIAFAVPNSAYAHEVAACYCTLYYNAKGELRHMEDVPFVSVYDGLQKVIPEQARIEGYDPDLEKSLRVRVQIDPHGNSDEAVTGINICNFGDDFQQIAEAFYKSALPKPNTEYGLPVAAAALGVLDIAALGAAGNLAAVAISSEDGGGAGGSGPASSGPASSGPTATGPTSSDADAPLGQGTRAVSN